MCFIEKDKTGGSNETHHCIPPANNGKNVMLEKVLTKFYLVKKGMSNRVGKWNVTGEIAWFFISTNKKHKQDKLLSFLVLHKRI